MSHVTLTTVVGAMAENVFPAFSGIFLLKNSPVGSNLYVTRQYIVSTPRGGESHINSRGGGIFPGVEFTTPEGVE